MAKRKPRKNKKRSAAAKRAFKKTGLYRWMKRKKKNKGKKGKKGHRKHRGGILGAKARAKHRGVMTEAKRKLIAKGYTPKQAQKILSRLERIRSSRVKTEFARQKAIENAFAGIGAAGAAAQSKRERFANFWRGIGGVGKVAV